MDNPEGNISEFFEIPELTNNMRNTANISKAAGEPQNQWDNFPDGPKPKWFNWNRKSSKSLTTLLQSAFDHLQTDFKDLLIIPPKDSLLECYQYCHKIASRKATVCLYGTPDSFGDETIPKKSDILIDKIVKKKVTLISSMTYLQGAEFKSVIAFLPRDSSETVEIVNRNRKTFLSRGNVLLRAVVNLVVVEIC